MDFVEFAQIMAFIEATSGKTLPKESIKAYYECLKDLPVEVLQIAAKKVVMEHKWASFPTVAELAQAAAETKQGCVSELSPAEAWEKAWRAVSNIDLEMEHTIEQACKYLPPLVYEAMRAFGLPALVCGKDPVGVVRGQFLKIYEQLAARDRRQALLPDSLKREIAEIGKQNKPAQLGETVNRIGQMPE